MEWGQYGMEWGECRKLDSNLVDRESRVSVEWSGDSVEWNEDDAGNYTQTSMEWNGDSIKWNEDNSVERKEWNGK